MRQSRLGIAGHVIGAFMSAVAAVGLAAAPALANDQNIITAGYQQKHDYPSMSQADAENFGKGKIVLHIGEGFPILTAEPPDINLNSDSG